MYLTDWSDTGECHDTDADGVHRENGRIYKITFGDITPVKIDLARLTDQELVDLQSHKNEWQVERHAGFCKSGQRWARTSRPHGDSSKRFSTRIGRSRESFEHFGP